MKNKTTLWLILNSCLAAAGLLLCFGMGSLLPPRSPCRILCTGEGVFLVAIGGRYLLNLAITAFYNRPEKADELAQMEEANRADQDERREGLRGKASRLAFLVVGYLIWFSLPILFALEKAGVLQNTLLAAIALAAVFLVQWGISSLCFFWLDKRS